MEKSKIKVYGFSVFITELVGGIAGLLTMGGMSTYSLVEKSSLTPPSVVFPIVWTILYALMGISLGRILLSPATKEKTYGIIIYALQLFVNFFWSIIFFNLQAYGFAFFWLILLWALILGMIIIFSKTDKLASYLQIPYLLWVTFAGYLNLIVWLLNK